jgi:hypothetical protein
MVINLNLWEKIGNQGIKFLANNHSKLSIILPRYSYKNTHKVHKFAKLHKVATRHWNTYRRKSHTRTQFDTVYHAIRHCHTVQHFPLLVIATQWNTYRRNTRYTHARTYARTHCYFYTTRHWYTATLSAVTLSVVTLSAATQVLLTDVKHAARVKRAGQTLFMDLHTATLKCNTKYSTIVKILSKF